MIFKSCADHRWKYGACTLHTGNLRLNLHQLVLCNNFCFTIAKINDKSSSILRCTYIACFVLNISRHSQLRHTNHQQWIVFLKPIMLLFLSSELRNFWTNIGLSSNFETTNLATTNWIFLRLQLYKISFPI